MLIALLALLLLWALLPLVPALIEVWRREDVRPLAVADDYAEELHEAPHRFAAHVRTYLDQTIDACLTHGVSPDPGAPPFKLIQGWHDLPVPGAPLDGRPYLLPGREAQTLSAGLVFEVPLFVRSQLKSGAGGVFDALFGERTIALAPGSRVRRWAHAVGTLTAGPHCGLYGSASSDAALHVHAGCAFERLHAPTIYFGPADEMPLPPATPVPPLPLMRYTFGGERPKRRTLIEGDFVIPAHHYFEGDLVVTGRLRVATGVRMAGSVKAHGDIILEADAHLDGGLFGSRDIRLGRSCMVTGVVVAEGRLEAAPGCRFGTRAQPTTVSGGHLRMAPGVCVYGTVWAIETGRVGAPTAISRAPRWLRRARRAPLRVSRIDRAARPAPGHARRPWAPQAE